MTAKLSGKALSERARELGIVGRSKLSADELRAAVILAEQIEETETVEEAPETGTEATFLVPNRADRRRAKRARKLRNDGSMKTTHPNFKPREVPVRVLHFGH